MKNGGEEWMTEYMNGWMTILMEGGKDERRYSK